MRVLYITNGMSSTLNSSFEVSRRLIAAGHEVDYASPADVGDRVRAEGYSFTRLDRDRHFVTESEAVTLSWRELLTPISFLRKLRAKRKIRRESIANDEIEQVVETLAPDVLIVDLEMHYALIAIARLGIPTVLAIVWFTLFRHPGLPPLHTDLQPGEASAIDYAWRRLRLSTIVGEWRRRAGQIQRCDLYRPVSYATYRIEDLRALARARQYNLGDETDRRQWVRPYAYHRLPILVFNVLEMEFPHEPHPKNHYVGPMIFRSRKEPQVDDAAGAAWRRFRDGRAPSRPLIYCSLGSFWAADERFLKRVFAVFERRAEWDLVLGLGGKLTAESFAPIPPNVLALDFAPQLEVLDVADCAITHGGITTINECIEYGVPMVVYSTKQVDQNGCAARVDYHRLGIVADKDADGPAEVEANVERALADREIRRRIEAMRRHFHAYELESAVVKTIERTAERDRV